MAVYQEKDKSKWTKDGRSWYFRVWYLNQFGIKKQKESKKYFTKKEALQAEREFLRQIEEKKYIDNKLTFKDLRDEYFKYKKEEDPVSDGTYQTYLGWSEKLESLYPIKMANFNLQTINNWKCKMNKLDCTTTYRNDVLTLLKSILNYGTDVHNISFPFYRKITNFKNPNELEKEMDFYTFEEYQQFISVESDLLYEIIFDTLFYMGLRKGELRGLQWKHIDFENKIMHIRVQIPSRFNVADYKLTPLKTKASKRDLPINKILFEKLEKIYELNSKYENFNKNWFVFGNALPISKEKIKDRKDKNCKLAEIKQIRVHDFRHSCASLLINNGASIVLVAKYLGHSSIQETLRVYAHLFKNKLQDIIDLMEKLQENER